MTALHAPSHAALAQQCAALQRLVRQGASGAVNDGLRAALTALTAAFRTTLAGHREVQEGELFPTLIESMAGSDAVCIREMTVGLRAEHRALEALWLRVQASLDILAAGQTVPWPTIDVEALLALCERHIAFEKEQLLPMAERLLSDAELARFAQAMQDFRIALVASV